MREFRNHNRIVRRWPAFDSHKRSSAFGLKLEQIVECRRNHDAPGEALSAWLEACPPTCAGDAGDQAGGPRPEPGR